MATGNREARPFFFRSRYARGFVLFATPGMVVAKTYKTGRVGRVKAQIRNACAQCRKVANATNDTAAARALALRRQRYVTPAQNSNWY